MENHFDKRTDPSKLLEGANSVISVMLNYYSSADVQRDPDAPVISTYAYGKDYHDVIRKKLNDLLQFMQDSMGPVSGRGFVDSAPVLDRAWAARVGTRMDRQKFQPDFSRIGFFFLYRYT